MRTNEALPQTVRWIAAIGSLRLVKRVAASASLVRSAARTGSTEGRAPPRPNYMRRPSGLDGARPSMIGKELLWGVSFSFAPELENLGPSKNLTCSQRVWEFKDSSQVNGNIGNGPSRSRLHRTRPAGACNR